MLIVDDIELNRAVLVGTFESDYKIVERENGAAALEYLEKHYMDVEIVLLDLLMPVMDGFQLLDKIRSDERMKDIPVIITSQGDSENEHRALKMQADDFISKPYNPDIIRHRVQNVIASHQLLLLKKAQRAKDSKDSNNLSAAEAAFAEIDMLKPHFDLVRLVEPNYTLVCRDDIPDGCEIHACYAVWGKATRCNNCISLKAFQDRTRHCKLEYSQNGLYFVISEYIPFDGKGAVVEMVTKLEDEYVDNIFDKKILYANLDSLHKQLEHGELCGIYNRRYIDSHLPRFLTEARSEGESLSIAMLDIDKFKMLNDTYGHLTGDVALKSVAKTLENCISANKGDFAARFGGDEFLVVCKNTGLDEMKRRMETAAGLVEHIKIDNGAQLKLGISAGCVCLDEYPDADAVGLIDIADKRLYKAKQTEQGIAFSD